MKDKNKGKLEKKLDELRGFCIRNGYSCHYNWDECDNHLEVTVFIDKIEVKEQ